MSATKDFVTRSNLALHHQFEKSKLFINPVIHGPPLAFDEQLQDMEVMLAKQAVVRNCSNAIVVYDNTLKSMATGKPWYSPAMRELLSPDHGLRRQELVTIAHLGVVVKPEIMVKRLDAACELAGLENIDIAIIEVSCFSVHITVICCSQTQPFHHYSG